MTSFAFIFGTLPLAVATGAGAGAHVAIGTAVVGGMFGATILVIYLVPMFFVVVLRLFRVRPKSHAAPSEPAPTGVVTVTGGMQTVDEVEPCLMRRQSHLATGRLLRL
jgi:multidrug efflux pump